MEKNNYLCNFRTYVRNAYVYHLNEIFSTVRNEYTDWDKPIVHPINVRDSTLEALSDGHTVSQILRLATVHARRGGPTHLFHFNYQPKDTDYHEVGMSSTFYTLTCFAPVPHSTTAYLLILLLVRKIFSPPVLCRLYSSSFLLR